ncbi:uncharacterized protein Nmag_2117 [Natrialba magadii ATCC 43099]|uniref:Cardiolipin synthase N-terminal domain-containing protein n=1 Tax=Natrialba magadii (strain ATCC 43099 / DSM 3394 / CCM 3739 / CIP 104546 / IAM 13178 / JCM 8861 / NBRC 102185 / NCIMB 2190 / MS3) TaxID=547559 RepID=D3SW25_NATMM|nr:PLD nuclease N-terminal domain-containing protein [Natrialba magadii]ADD05686.1 uncharacterized protein Nmag_2117 [Natrialba magadii ATCC 43099]ELY29902.1 hypothetical protein C500_09839 [Natrialba magadii ATCC 43099]
MDLLLLAIVVGIPLAWHIGLTAFTYYDAGNVGLEPPMKWAAITFFIPLFGFFIYLFERSELDYDPETDPYRGHNFNIHPSRADDTPIRSRGDNRLSPEDEQEGGVGSDRDRNGESTTDHNSVPSNDSDQRNSREAENDRSSSRWE